MPDSSALTEQPATPQLRHPARLSLGNASPTVSTDEHLRFQLDHALARDAVHTPLDIAALQRSLTERGLQPVVLHSLAPDRTTYLRRPDLGRTLHPDSIAALEELEKDFSSRPESAFFADGAESGAPGERSLLDGVQRPASEAAPNPTVLFLLADGLSALALERHTLPLLDATLPLLRSTFNPRTPILTNARVALADPIGQILGAQMTVLLIGERPGLSSTDSLGCYLTWDPRPGRTDAERNCISNIRGAEGLSYAEAAHRIAHYVREAHRLHTTGTALKDPPTSTPLL
jgi:ethanolamine ammonia-lyase small subunit